MAKVPMTKKVQLDNLINVEEDQFPSNSKASRKDEQSGRLPSEIVNDIKKKPKVKIVKRRKSITRAIKQSLFSEDSNNVFQYVIYEVLLPAAKSMLSDMFTQGIEMALFGEGSSRKRSRDRGDRSLVSYGDMYKRRDESRDPARYAPRRDRFKLNDIYFKNGPDASDVLADLCDQLEEYEQVTVAYYLDLVGVDDTSNWVAADWGWTNLKKAYCTHTRNGYKIVLPEPIELD